MDKVAHFRVGRIFLTPTWIFICNKQIFFSRSNCGLTIPSHRKVIQQLRRSPPPSTVWDVLTLQRLRGGKVAMHHPVPNIQYWGAVPRQQHCRILVDHAKAALETSTTFAEGLCSSNSNMGAGTMQSRDRPFPASGTHLLHTLWSSNLHSFSPVSSDVELQLWCVLTTISSLWRGWGVLFNLLCEKCHVLEDKGLKHVSEIIQSSWFRSESEEKLLLAVNILLSL